MSTIPTEITAATEGSLDIASIKSVMDGFDPASLLPDLSKVFGSLVGVCRVAVMIGPVIALILGLAYLFLAPKEATTTSATAAISAWAASAHGGSPSGSQG